MQISNKSRNKPLWLFPLKINWEWKLATFIYEYTNHQILQFQLKATLIFYKMESAIQFQAAFSFCLSSAIKKSVSTFCITNQLLILLVEYLQFRADSHLQLGGIPGDTAMLLRSGWCSAWTEPESTGWSRGVSEWNMNSLLSPAITQSQTQSSSYPWGK